MALASLLDAGADVAEVVAGLEGLPVKGWSVEATRSTSSGLGATRSTSGSAKMAPNEPGRRSEKSSRAPPACQNALASEH